MSEGQVSHILVFVVCSGCGVCRLLGDAAGACREIRMPAADVTAC